MMRTGFRFQKHGIVLAFCWTTLMIVLPLTGHAQPSDDPDRVRAIAWSPDGTRMAVSFDGGRIEISDTYQVDPSLVLGVDTSRIIALAWSPDGTILATGSGYPESALRLWDTSTGELINTYQDFGYDILVASWSPDGRYLVSTTAEPEFSEIGNAIVVDTVSGQIQYLSVKLVSGLAWSSNNEQLAFMDIAQGIEVRSVSDWSIIAIYSYGDYPVRDNLFPQYVNLEWSPDGRFLAAGRGDGQVLVWRIGTTQPFLVLSGSEYVGDDLALGWIHDLRFDEQQPYLTSIAGDGLVRTWNVETGMLVTEQRVSANVDAAFSPLGVRLALAPVVLDENAPTAAIVPAQTLDLIGRAEVQIVVPPVSTALIDQLYRRCADMVTGLQAGTNELVEPVDDQVFSRLCTEELNAVIQSGVMQSSGD